MKGTRVKEYTKLQETVLREILQMQKILKYSSHQVAHDVYFILTKLSILSEIDHCLQQRGRMPEAFGGLSILFL